MDGFLRNSGLLMLHDDALWQVLDDWISQGAIYSTAFLVTMVFFGLVVSWWALLEMAPALEARTVGFYEDVPAHFAPTYGATWQKPDGTSNIGLGVLNTSAAFGNVQLDRLLEFNQRRQQKQFFG